MTRAADGGRYGGDGTAQPRYAGPRGRTWLKSADYAFAVAGGVMRK